MYSFNCRSIIGKKRWKYRKKKYIYIYKYLAYYFIRFPVRFSRSHQDHPLNNNYEMRKRREISKDFEMTLKIIKKKKNRRSDAIALRSRIERRKKDPKIIDRKSLDLFNEMNRNPRNHFSKSEEST